MKGAYNFILYDFRGDEFQYSKRVWNNIIPKNMSVFVWTLCQNKQATGYNLVKRGVLDEERALCPLCHVEFEYLSHLFFCCSDLPKVWYFIFDWLRIIANMINEGGPSFQSFMGLVGCAKMLVEIMSCI